MIFANTIGVNDFAPIGANTSFNSLRPIITAVEEEIIVPIIGNELYSTFSGPESEMSTLTLRLRDRCRQVAAPMVCYRFTFQTEVKLSDQGAQRNETANSKTAYQNQVNNFKEAMLNQCGSAIERLYAYLELNKVYYPEWTNSEVFKNFRSLFIKSAGEFHKLFHSASPYRNYYAMRATMYDVEVSIIKPALGDTLFAELKAIEQDPEGTFTEPQQQLLLAIKKATAYLTVAGAIPFLNVRLDSQGLTIANGNNTQDDLLGKKSAADAISLNRLIEACNKQAARWMNSISAWVKTNTPSSIITAAPTPSGNVDRKGSFGLI